MKRVFRPNPKGIAFAALAGVLMAACAPPPARTAAPTTANASTTETSPATTSETPAAQATSADAFPVTIKHMKGETVIASQPMRIAAMDWPLMEDVLALGVYPVGVSDIKQYNDWVDIGIPLNKDAVDLGLRGEPNLELLAQLKPDLILAPGWDEKSYEKYAAIAPTILFASVPEEGKGDHLSFAEETFTTVARAVGRVEQSKIVLDHMHAHFAEAKAKLARAGFADAPVVVSQGYSNAGTLDLRLFTDNAMAVRVMQELGLRNAWKDKDFQEWGFSQVSLEVLPTLGDVNFFYVVPDAENNLDQNPFADTAVKPMWDSLEFVKQGKAYPLGADAWFFGGPLSAEVIADRVVKLLVP